MNILQKENGATLLTVMIIGFIIALITMVTFLSTHNSMNAITHRKNVVSAFNIAEAGKEHTLAQLRSRLFSPKADSTMVIFNNQPFEKGTYTVECRANTPVDTVLIRSCGLQQGNRAMVEVLCAVNKIYEEVDFDVTSAITARSAVSTTGNISIDGRDWDPVGDTVMGNGVYGIKSCGSITQQGSSTIGGNGIAPSTTLSVNTVQNNVSAVGYPSTPEQALGVASGVLDDYKTSAIPSLPFTGIVYFIPRDAQGQETEEFNCPDLKGSKGIFIVHNSARTATIKNFNGDFTGIIISDKIELVNANSNIMGAVMTLSEEEGHIDVFGNGNASIKYSSKVIADIKSTMKVVTSIQYNVVSWKQTE